MAPQKENSSIKMHLYLWQFWFHWRRLTIFSISKKNLIDYNDEISKFWKNLKNREKKTKNEIIPRYESHWGTQNQMRLENYPQCDTQWASQNHKKRVKVNLPYWKMLQIWNDSEIKTILNSFEIYFKIHNNFGAANQF